MGQFFKTNSVKILTIVLLVQAGVFYSFSRGEQVPKAKPLSDFSLPSAQWVPVRDQQLDQETLDVLKADDILSRIYVNRESRQAADLFVAYFSTQRTGKTPHSPKNCLPGTGWTPSEAGTIEVPVNGEPTPLTVNRYLVSRDQSQSLVLYWYQGHNRVIASEYRAKLFTVLDSVRLNRSDTAIVRVVTNVADGDTERAVSTGIAFIKTFFGPLKQYLPA
jgi:EpsI family protein